MIVAIVLLFIFAVALLAINYKNRHTWVFVLMSFSIACMMLAMILLVSKMSAITAFFNFENKIYMWLSNRKIGFYEAVNILNFGIFVYMLAMWMFARFFEPTKKDGKRVLINVISLIPAVLFFIVNSSEFCRKLHAFVYYSLHDAERAVAFTVLEVARYLNYAIVIFYILYPIVTFIMEYHNTNIMYKKHKITVMVIVLSFINVFYIYMLFISTFEFSLIDLTNLLKFNNAYLRYSQVMYTIIPFAVLVLFEGTVVMLAKFRVLERVDFFKKLTISKRTKLLFSDIRPVLHSYKNVLISLKFLSESIEENYGTPQGLEDVKELQIITEKSAHSLSNLLSVFNESEINIEEADICERIEKAVKLTVVDRNIKVEYDFPEKRVEVLCDKRHITRMFENMLYNAIEAVEENESEKRIEIYVKSESDWILTSIRDNGCGIPRKNMKKIFKPLFSTKHNSKSWGIGLSYVYKVLSAHNGLIFVESEEGKYTEFQILLPTMKEIDLDE